MSSLAIIFLLISLLTLLCESRKIRYIATEQPVITFYEKYYVSYANITSRRYGRNDPFYYVALNFYMNYEFHNNISLDFYFYEFLTNRYRRGFVEMHFKFCDLVEKDDFFGSALRQGKFLTTRCPYPAGVYNFSNMTVPIQNIPHNFPFTKGRIYLNMTATTTHRLIASGHINMEIKEVHTNKLNWVDKE